MKIVSLMYSLYTYNTQFKLVHIHYRDIYLHLDLNNLPSAFSREAQNSTIPQKHTSIYNGNILSQGFGVFVLLSNVYFA